VVATDMPGRVKDEERRVKGEGEERRVKVKREG
jgi:hypothetical protein